MTVVPLFVILIDIYSAAHLPKRVVTAASRETRSVRDKQASRSLVSYSSTVLHSCQKEATEWNAK